MKKKKITWIIIGLVIIGGGYYWYAKAHASKGQIQYVTAPAQQGTLTMSVSGSGNVIVDQSATVDPTITGTVANLAVKVGDQVTKGQTLFSIVNDQLGLNVTQAEASYQSAESAVVSAQASYHDTKKSSTSSHQDKEAAQSKIDSAQQSLDSAQASLAYQQQQAAQRVVKAPISGTVNAINIKNGDDLSRVSGSSSNAQAPIIIGDLGTLKAQVEVNEVDIPNVKVGQKATMTFSAIDGLTATGKVEKMDSLGTVSQGVVTYNVTIDFDSLDPRIRPEMSVSANIITEVRQDVITVPSGAVKTQGGNSNVEVLNSGNAPTQVPVQIGESNNTDTEITSGIKAGDNVVTQTIDPNAAGSSASSSSSRGGFGIFGGGGGGGAIRTGGGGHFGG